MNNYGWAIAALGTVLALYLIPRLFNNSKQCDDGCQHNHNGEKQEIKKYQRLPVGLINKEQIAQYRGLNGSRIFVSVCGRIFDVTAGADYYGPEGPYHCFTGADASYMLATMSLEDSQRNKIPFDLQGDEQITLSDWIVRFRQKYPMVGRLEGYENVAKESWREAGIKEEKENHELKNSTLEELKNYKNNDKYEVFISICGNIFDVSSARMVYDSYGSDFNNSFNDFSLCLAQNNFNNIELLNQSLSSIENDNQMKSHLKDMLTKFEQTYPIVGKLVENKFDFPLNNNNNNNNQQSNINNNNNNNNGHQSQSDNEDWDILDRDKDREVIEEPGEEQ